MKRLYIEMERCVIFLLTGTVSYMLKAGKFLKTLYTNMIYVTCTTHNCNRLVEKVRKLFSNIIILINDGKKIFLKESS